MTLGSLVRSPGRGGIVHWDTYKCKLKRRQGHGEAFVRKWWGFQHVSMLTEMMAADGGAGKSTETQGCALTGEQAVALIKGFLRKVTLCLNKHKVLQTQQRRVDCLIVCPGVGGILLPQVPYVWVIVHEEIKLVLTKEHHPCRIKFTLARGAMHSVLEKK